MMFHREVIKQDSHFLITCLIRSAGTVNFLYVDAEGDLLVDPHHTVEDVGITIGQALYKALGNKVGIKGLAVPMRLSMRLYRGLLLIFLVDLAFISDASGKGKW